MEKLPSLDTFITNPVEPKGLPSLDTFETPATSENKQPDSLGFLPSVAKSIFQPVANLIARPGQAVAHSMGDTEPIRGKFLGLDISDPYTDVSEGKSGVGTVLGDTGRALETASLAVGGGGTVNVVKAGLKGLIAQGAKTGFVAGIKSGALLGFGQGLQEASDKPMEEAFKTVVEDTALNTVLGGALGGAFGGVAPIVARPINSAKGAIRSVVNKFYTLPEVETKLASKLKTILNPTTKQIETDTRFGRDSLDFISKEMPDIPLNVDKNGRLQADDAVEMMKQKYAAEATAYKPIIRNSGKFIDIDEAIVKAKAQAKKELDGTDLIKAERQIDDEVNAYLAKSPEDVNVTASGKRFVTLARADDIKTYSWARGKGWGTPDAEVWSDTNNILGHTIKDAIEKELPSAPIKAMNSRLGDWKNAIDLVEKRNGNVAGGGGKLGKYFVRSVGTTIGGGMGGDDSLSRIGGAGAGFMTANMLASAMANPNVRLFVVRQLLNNLKKAGRTDMILEAKKILNEEANKYLLPAKDGSSYIEHHNVINLPESARETNLGLNEVKNAQIPNASQIQDPITAPTAQSNINSNMSRTLPTNEGKVNAGLSTAVGAGTAIGYGLSKTSSKSEYNSPDQGDTNITAGTNPDKLKKTLMQLESSGGKNKANADKGEMKWLTGLTDIAIKELKRVGLLNNIDVNDKEDVLNASNLYFTYLQSKHPKLSPAEIYVDYYWAGSKNKEQRQKKIDEFNKLMK